MQETDPGESPDYLWKDPTSKIVVLKEDNIDIEAEAHLYDQICEVWSSPSPSKYVYLN
jgi:hypothetical protein